MPTIASPKSSDSSASILASLKLVTALTIACARFAGSPDLKIPEPTNTPSAPSCIISAASAGVAGAAEVRGEDQAFPDHNGFDWKSIEKAMKYNKKKPGRVRGASTISQQVAKNVFLWQGRSWLRKGLEVYFTFMIELCYSKKRILELYLNVAEMGEGVFGIEAAAQKYFGKPASQLSRAEAAQIAACLPNPKIYTVKPISRYVAARYPYIMRQMANLEGDPDIRAIIQPKK